MKRIILLALLITLTACSENTRKPLYPTTGVSVKTLSGYFDGKISVLCIDGIKYIATEQGGITVKFQSWSDTDPTVEECE